MKPAPARPLLALLAAATLVAAPAPAAAQLEPGLQLAWAPDLAGGSFGIGARMASSLGPALPGLKVRGTFDYFLPDCAGDCDFWDLSGAVTYLMDIAGSDVHPYFGGGVAFHSLSQENAQGATIADEDDFGFNVVAGAEARGALALRPFLEVRYDMMDDLGDQLVVSLGVAF